MERVVVNVWNSRSGFASGLSGINTHDCRPWDSNFCHCSPNLKMLGLYHYTLIIGHKSCNMLSILNKLTLSNELQTFVTNNVFLDKKSKNTTTTEHKIKLKNPCRSRGLNQGPLAPKAVIPRKSSSVSVLYTGHVIGAALKCEPIMEWEFILASGRSSF